MSTLSKNPYDAVFNHFFGLPTYPYKHKPIKFSEFVDEITRLNDGTYKLVLEVPGFSKENVTVQAKESVLTIHLKNETKEKKTSYQLAKTVDQDKITATCKDGILTVLCPLRESVTKTVNISVG